ncbi:TetR family transcriptional regulator [Frondihabitans sp. PhB188]|uniref:TetR/AcrR family transcriptional regulator n=1 Tax=Frondihabitans sp. PhB188 TaxID=2485200 RepID=UPI000FA6163A|nr:TetR/AcrR family transcriptional regulator [Frondihabitans sp. PhB188]ROQ40703.1 TetR family transcriptional regulator [Frondihabitans sp. PhB188]
MTDGLPHLLRSDAQSNRDRVLAAARELFATEGLGVPMREISRRAGVGPATLYRRFPTKPDLVAAAFADELSACRAIVEDGAADPAPWRGLQSVIVELTELNARNHGFVEAFTSQYPDAADFTTHRRELLHLLTSLVRRAQESGELRADFVMNDLMLVLLAGRGLAALPPSRRDAAARRFADLAIDALRASA